ncbi:oleosin S1-2-like [Cynara cardunculus var. scolymus]|uniref:oleosin S1-2-like n=1 Tax=Cynara cardunculus var. scolymus TaxID=59895 RepID=UPI000D62ED3B|nr:oleosin S1-2-like [Cynara cardunculus var. scolymus]
MDGRYNGTGQPHLKKQPRGTIIGDGRPPFRRLEGPYPEKSTQLMGIMALFVSSGLLFIISGITVVTTVLGLICFAPIIIITSPIWVPFAILLSLVVAGVLSLCVFGLVAAAVVDLLVVQVLMKRLRLLAYEELFERNQKIGASREF